MILKRFITLSFLLSLITLNSGSFAQQDTVFMRQMQVLANDSQAYKTDTFIFESPIARHILAGTCLMPNTSNQLHAYGHGLWFEKVVKSDCHKGGKSSEGGQDKINNIVSTDTSLIIDMTIYENCCYDFLADISVDSLSTLHLIYHGYGSNCACTCCFGLTYYFSKIKDPEYKIIKAVMINDEKRSMKTIK